MKFEFRDEQDAAALAGRQSAPDHKVRRLEFDLPNSVLAQLIGAGAAYLAMMYVAFSAAQGLGLIFVVFALVLVAYYGLPALMQAVSGHKTDSPPRRGAWGIDTASGYLSGRAAWVQVMTVPALMVLWAAIMAVMF